MTLLLKNGYVVDPTINFEGNMDILVENKEIVKAEKSLEISANEIVDCSGLVIFPGLCDMHVHLRDPGQTHKEDIISGAKSAAAGGFTAIACMPNTSPVIDSPELVKYVLDKARDADVKIYPIASITKGILGDELCDYKALKEAGAVAVSDDGRPVTNAKHMMEAMEKAHYAGLKVISHCEDLDIAGDGIINKGAVSEKLNVEGIDRTSELLATSREIALSLCTVLPIHIAHVSIGECIGIINAANNGGVMATTETCPHYFALTEDELLKKDADYRMNPPLRTKKDVYTITRAVCNGVIDCIVTDHAPHSPEEKADFMKAPNGVIGLETSLAVTLTYLYHTKATTLMNIARLMSVNPRRILGLNAEGLTAGSIADITVFDPNEKWRVEPEKFKSKSRNSCFKGMELTGKVKYTIVNGKVVYKGE